MITELTDAQKAVMPRYVQKWINIGRNTDRLNFDRTTDICNAVETRLLGKDKPNPVVIFDNPKDAWIACHYALKGATPNELHGMVKNYHSQEKGKKDIELETFYMPYLCGSFDASTFAFYDYMATELNIDLGPQTEQYKIWESTSELGLIFPMENVCIVSEKPSQIHLNAENRIHADGRAAIEYVGMKLIYALNGLIVPDWLALTKSTEIPLNRYTEITNADIKMEFVKKVGIERMLEMGKKIDSYENYNEEWWTKSQYELWDMHTLFPGIAFAPHLKMLNQTTGVWHVEAVSPSATTLEAAIKERMGGRDLNIVCIA